MRTVLRLLRNDLKRDAKRPWSMLLLVALPLVLSMLIASVFGGQGHSGPMPTVHVAILDQDKDLLTRLLRSLPTQGDAARHLRIHVVESKDEGLRLVEKSEVSAFVVLPAQMTERLLNGSTNAIELYENPAQQILPKVVRQAASLLALGLSAAAETLGEPLRDMRELIQNNDFPLDSAVTGVASASVQRLRGLRTYLFPPLIEFQTVSAADFTPLSTNALPVSDPP